MQQVQQFLPFILMFVVIYFFMIRPQQKRVKQEKQFVADIKVGDKILITGHNTGAQEMVIDEMYVNDIVAEKASKGDSCTFKLPFRIRLSDKLYKIVEA